MFKRKLLALDYHNIEKFDFKDDEQFRNLIVWLEDQKIRHYKIEDRQGLRNIASPEWPNFFNQYLDDLGCSIKSKDQSSLTDWILGYAVRLEYADHLDEFKTVLSAAGKTPANTTSDNPLNDLDFQSADFKAGVASLATLLQIPPHQDHLTVLKAVCFLVNEKFSKEALERVNKEGTKQVKQTIPLEKVDLGFETSDYITAEASKILRLLHIRDLRELQNRVNEAIVAVQSITANPKTDTKLGKVGRG